MRRLAITMLLASLLNPVSIKAQDSALTYKVYGFIRNYVAVDTRESEAGTLDLLYFLPKDREINVLGDDLNQQTSFRFLTLTSRVGMDVLGYKHKGMTASAKIEADFYSLNGSTATFRLRQAYMDLGWKLYGGYHIGLKIGQAWHPMGVDMPDVLALAVGAPFGPFNRSPQVSMEYKLDKSLSFNLSAIWQMQFLSNGPEGTSANYMKYCGIPEIYAGVNYYSDSFLFKLGADVLTIKPRNRATYSGYKVRAFDYLTTFSPFVYSQYKSGDFVFKGKSILAQGGEHLNLMSGYALAKKIDETKYLYTPYLSSSTWLNFTYGRELKAVLLLGYMKNFGTAKRLVGYNEQVVELAKVFGDEESVFNAMHSKVDASVVYFNKGAYNLNQIFRAAPNLLYDFGRLTIGLEYELTGAQYGDKSRINQANGLADTDLHWVMNHRCTFMTKFSF